MVMIRNFMYHLCQVSQYLNKMPYPRLRPAFKDIKTWMANNLLKLNDGKTELSIPTIYSIGKIRKYRDKPTADKMIIS